MKSVHLAERKRPGRPLSFDRDVALQKAMRQFWSTGYETTSIADLTSALGVTAPSLYTAFGDKESLFLACVERYSNPGPKTTAQLIAEAPSSYRAAKDLLESSARWFTQSDAPAGCLVASAASSGNATSQRVRAALQAVRAEIRLALQKRAERDMREGKLPRKTKAKALAAMVSALIQGMSTLARDGAKTEELLELVRAALQAWPSEQQA